jgi:hypothetical protein
LANQFQLHTSAVTSGDATFDSIDREVNKATLMYGQLRTDIKLQAVKTCSKHVSQPNNEREEPLSIHDSGWPNKISDGTGVVQQHAISRTCMKGVQQH